MHVNSVALTSFRNWSQSEVEFSQSGLNFVVGDNAQGKTNLLEAIHFVLQGESFRTTDKSSLVATGADQAVLRSIVHLSTRELHVDALISAQARSRHQLNNKPLKRISELQSLFQVVTFQPEDLEIIKDGPGLRRDFIDAVLVGSSLNFGELRDQYDRILRQRNTLLRQIGGKLSSNVIATLDIWDQQCAEVGEKISSARELAIQQLDPIVNLAYQRIAEDSKRIGLHYERSWEGDLHRALLAQRSQDVARQITTLGPHRDDLVIEVQGLSSRNQSSQGEQRTLAYALKLGAVEYLTQKRGDVPVIILDDVVSELDRDRVRRLFSSLPTAQVFVSGTAVPVDLVPNKVFQICHGRVA